MDVIEKIDFDKVGKRMKQLRNEQGITQEKIAKDLGSTIVRLVIPSHPVSSVCKMSN